MFSIVEMMTIIFFLALICEVTDASFGMGYGTILAPLLLIVGYEPAVIVPAILLSQAAGGFTASVFHHRYKNVDFKLGFNNSKSLNNNGGNENFLNLIKPWISKDLQVVILITVLGMLSIVLAVFVAISIPTFYVKLYIACMVTAIGCLLIVHRRFRFSWKKLVFVGMVAAFNKGVSGGGFGPVTTGGQIIAGQRVKNSIGVTTLAEPPICGTGFLIYLLTNQVSNWHIILAMTLGAVIAAPIGAMFTRKLPEESLKIIAGFLILALGILSLCKILL